MLSKVKHKTRLTQNKVKHTSYAKTKTRRERRNAQLC